MAGEPALYARMELRIKDFERQLAKAEARAAQGTQSIGREADRAGKKLEGRLALMAGRLGAQIAGAFAVYAAVQAGRELTETATRIQNALKVAGLEGENLEGVYRKLFEAAQANSAPIESMVQLYSRLALAQKELGVSSDDLISFTGNIALALRVAGTDAAGASGALLELSQALGGGVVRAEEFNSVMEGAPTIVQAAAAGIEEAGGSVAKLRQLVNDGKVSSAAFFNGFQAGAQLLEQRGAGSVSTISQEFIRLQNVLIDVAREFDEATGASQTAARLVRGIGDALQYVGDNADTFVAAASKVLAWIKDIGGAAKDAAEYVASLLSTADAVPLKITVNGSPTTDARAGSSRRGGASMAPAPSPVSLEDYPVEGGKKKKDRAARENDYQRLTQMITQRTSAIQAETAAQAGLNPLVNDYGFAVEKARAAHDLLNAAQEAGLAITPELEGQIDQLATSYANASVVAAKLAESHDSMRQASQNFRDMGRDALGGFISDLRNGVSAAEALSNALDRVIDRLLDSALDSLFSPTGGSGILGSIGKLFGFASGGYTGPGGKNQPAGVVHKGEFVFSKDAVKKLGLGNLQALHRGFASGGYVGTPTLGSPTSGSRRLDQLKIGVSVDLKGANGDKTIAQIAQAATARGVQQALAAYDGRLLPNIQNQNRRLG